MFDIDDLYDDIFCILCKEVVIGENKDFSEEKNEKN